MLAEHGKILGGPRVTAVMRSDECFLRVGQAVVLNQEHPELERTVGIATLVGASVGADGAVDVPPLL